MRIIAPDSSEMVRCVPEGFNVYRH
jgi:hypothetical protein